MFRAMLIATAGLALTGCNLVYSDTPVFSAADAANAPVLRPGLWAEEKTDCRFDEGKPRASWPECADSFLIGPETLTGVEKDRRVSYPYLLAAGRPRIGQMRWSEDGKDPVYVFGGVRPRRLDDQGRIIAFTSWVAQCGPLQKDGNPTKGTSKPLPGLTMDADGGNCKPVDKEAVRRAVRASERWDDSPGRAHWVRDAEE